MEPKEDSRGAGLAAVCDIAGDLHPELSSALAAMP